MACKRRVCFFAHHEGELRKVDDEGAPSSGKDADLLAGDHLPSWLDAWLNVWLRESLVVCAAQLS